ncbi:MAG TPA: hypothetical protein VF832_20925 [Longimicrobiales bacterium]
MDLVRDLLDNRVLDRGGRPMGRVDGIVLRVLGDTQPVVTEIQLGGLTPIRRMRSPFRNIAGWFARRWGMLKGEPYRIPWSRVQDVGIDVRVAVELAETPLVAWERRARRIIDRIPGA